jgi:hypothetical protein
MKEYSCYIKRGLTDPVSRELIINGDYITFQNKSFTKDAFTTFFKNEITDYRFGIYWLRLDITFGRQYKIYIRNKENQILKITFKSYLKYKVNTLHQQYCDILDAIWKFHFSEITDNYLKQFENGEEFTLGSIRFSKDGLYVNKKNDLIKWEDVRTSNYYSYFAIYSEKDPSKVNSQFNYMNDWNTTVLYSTLRTILKYKKIEIYD